MSDLVRETILEEKISPNMAEILQMLMGSHKNQSSRRQAF